MKSGMSTYYGVMSSQRITPIPEEKTNRHSSYIPSSSFKLQNYVQPKGKLEAEGSINQRLIKPYRISIVDSQYSKFLN